MIAANSWVLIWYKYLRRRIKAKMNSMRCAELIYHPSLFDYTSPVTNLIPLLFVPKQSRTSIAWNFIVFKSLGPIPFFKHLHLYQFISWEILCGLISIHRVQQLFRKKQWCMCVFEQVRYVVHYLWHSGSGVQVNRHGGTIALDCIIWFSSWKKY